MTSGALARWRERAWKVLVLLDTNCVGESPTRASGEALGHRIEGSVVVTHSCWLLISLLWNLRLIWTQDMRMCKILFLKLLKF